MTIAPATRSDESSLANPVEQLHALVADDMDATDALIHERMASGTALIPQLAKHLIDSGGKRLRPMLTLAAARMFGYRGDVHIKLAAAVEFIHTATLLHDDVVDMSGMRRGKQSANVLWGNKPSVLVGDFLFSRAFQLMVEAGDLKVLHILSNASAVIAEGEVMQLSSANNLATTEERYLAIVRAKTAALFASAAEAGASIASAAPEQTAALRRYGEDLGVAFQLVDDALDYSGRATAMGKAVGDDFREAKVTLPVILAHARADEEQRRFWQRAIETGPHHESDLQRAIDYVEATGAHHDTRKMAADYVDSACAALDVLPQGAICDSLRAVARSSVNRAG